MLTYFKYSQGIDTIDACYLNVGFRLRCEEITLRDIALTVKRMIKFMIGL